MPQFEQKTYLVEHDTDEVKGFTILRVHEGKYHIGEKWLNDERGDVWLDYLIPFEQVERRVEDGECEPKGKLTDRQFEKVCEKVGWDGYPEGETPAEKEVEA